MSGLAGIYHLDGRPVDPARLGRMAAAVAHRGPDGEACWTDGGVGLAQAMLCTTPESLDEKAPLLDETGALCLTLDGRVDNREELATWLRGGGVRLRTGTDAELVLRAYELWGDGCPSRIVGDFALALWDGRRRRLFCARDPLGIKPFYYHLSGPTLLWGSELRQVLGAMERAPEPNEGVVAEYLSHRLVDLAETLYRGVMRLPPGHVLTVDARGARTTRYFGLDPRREIRYRSDDEYAAHFREIFREAVRCRLRSPTPVAVFLSGGVDSSAIVGMAGLLAREREGPGSVIEAYSLGFSHPAGDERAYVDDVVRRSNVPLHRLAPERAAQPSLATQVAELRGFPDFPGMHPWGLLYDEASQRGARVALWGLGGDEWLTGTPMHCADLLRQLRVLRLARQVRDDVRVYKLLSAARVGPVDALQWCVLPLIPRAAKRLARRVGGLGVPGWIARGFARRVSLAERLARRVVEPPFGTYAQRAIAGHLQNGWRAAEYETVDRFEARRSMESRHPFNDRRLIEFALALPEEQRWRGTETKFILRRAAQDLLPASVARRSTKGDFAYLFADAIEREGGAATLGRLRLAGDGFVDADRVLAMYRRLRAGDTRQLGPVWMILGTEVWYRTMFPASRAARLPGEAT